METQKYTKESIQALLQRSDSAVIRAVQAIYKYQTHAEKEIGHTIEHNGIGFNGIDSEFLSSIAEQIECGRYLSDKQIDVSRKMIKKYWKQLKLIADKRESKVGRIC